MAAAILSDKELLDAFRKESSREKAFEAIIRQYQQKIYWHVRRMLNDHADADDVTQNTFIKAWENLLNFREESRLYTWLFRVATNEALAFLSKKKQMLSMDELDNESLEPSTLGDGPAAKQIAYKLELAIAQLPEKQKIVFNLKYYEEMKYEEMAEVLETSVGALKASYHHAVKKIQEFMSQD